MPLKHGLFAFGFGSLPMLGWLVVAAAPLLIHLLSRRRYLETTWAAMEFLLAAMKRNARRLQLEQWLLLALRTLIVALLALAVAEPFWESAGAPFSARGGTHHLIVIDGSYSMSYRGGERSRFDTARQFARAIVDSSASGDAFTLILGGSPPQTIVGAPSLSPADMLREIDALEITHGGFDLPATLSSVEQVLAGVGRELPRLQRHEVYVLSDLQRASWLPDLSAAAMSDFRQRAERIAQQATLWVVNVGQGDAENVAVTRVEAVDPVATPGQPLTIEATLKNLGRQARAKQSVELWVDGRRVAQPTLELPATGENSLPFSYRLESAGDHVLEVRTSGDALELDNRRLLVMSVRQALEVLCIDGRPAGEGFQGASDYLRLALAPLSETPQSAVRVEAAGESALSERDLGRYDCIFLCAVPQFTSQEVRLLDAYLRGGGTLVFFLGDGVMAERYNQELGGGRGQPRILPAKLGAVVPEPQERLDPLDFRHPLVKVFRGRGRAGLLTTPVYKHFKLLPVEGAAAKTALALGNGDPLVIEEPRERGHVLLVATAADVSWGPMPLWPSYVSLVQEMLAFGLRNQARQRNVDVGQPLTGMLPVTSADAVIRVSTPDGRTQNVAPKSEGPQSQWSFAETLRAGIYSVEFGAPDRVLRYAVNLDTTESDLSAISREELDGEVFPGIKIRYEEHWQTASDESTVPPSLRPANVAVPLLTGVLGLLLLETLVAWGFGHHRA